MDNSDARIFERTANFKFLVNVFNVFMMCLMVLFIVVTKPNLWEIMGCVALMLILPLGFLVMASDKITVTCNEIIHKNILKKQIIPFDKIKLMRVGRVRNMYLLYVTTEQYEIGFNGGATKKQLNEMMEYILERVRLNNPEHYKLINSPKNATESFWRK